MGPTKEDKEPLLDSAGNPQVLTTDEDAVGVGSEAYNEPIDGDDTDLPDDEPDPSDHAQVDHDAWPEPP